MFAIVSGPANPSTVIPNIFCKSCTIFVVFSSFFASILPYFLSRSSKVFPHPDPSVVVSCVPFSVYFLSPNMSERKSIAASNVNA